MDRRFFHRLGASLLDRTICASAGAAGYKATIGASIGTDPERFAEARLILIWGSNPITSNVHLWPLILEAQRNGARVVAIDPYRSLTAEKCDQHLALLPGTDGALALGMMHLLIAEDRLDRDYIDRYTVGFDALRERVAAYPPARVASTATGASVSASYQTTASFRSRSAVPGLGRSASPASGRPSFAIAAARGAAAIEASNRASTSLAMACAFT